MEGKNVSPAVAVIVILIVIVIVLAVGWSIFLKKPKAPEGTGDEMSGMMPEGSMMGGEGMPEGAMPTEGPEEGVAPETEEGETEEVEAEGEEEEEAPAEEGGEETEEEPE